MSGLLRHGIMQRSHKAQHRRIRSLERRASSTDAEVARLRGDVDAVMNAMRMMHAPADGQAPPELASAIACGQPDVKLEVGGQEVVAVLDAGRPGDVIDILRAVRRCAAGGEDVAS
jgi:hypothetical protein